MPGARLLLTSLAAAASVCWMAVSPHAGQDLPVAKPRPIVIIGGTLIDGTGVPARRNDAIVIRDGRIAAMGLSAGRKAPRDARLIDGSGKWILPGFIDAATHLFRTGNLDTHDAALFPSTSDASIAAADIGRAPTQYLRPYVCAGVTSVLNIGGPPWTFDLRDGRVDDALSPRIGTTGTALVLSAPTPGWPVKSDERALLATSPDQAAELIEGLRPSKPTLVAIILAEPPDGIAAISSLADAAVAAAHARRLRALVEVDTPADLRAAVNAHADVVVSRVSDPIDEDTVRRIVGQHIIIVPTMVVRALQGKVHQGDLSAAGFEAACAPAASLESLAAWKALAAKGKPREPDRRFAQALDGERRNVRRLAEAGAMIVAGSGAGEDRVFHGPSLHWELELLAGAGLTPMQIILSATRDAALLLGRADLGQVKEGMAGDLVLVGADPLADIRNARKVVLTIRGGALYER